MKRFAWCGRRYDFEARRHWNHFFDFAVFLKFRNLKIEKLLSNGPATMVQDFFALTEQARVDFESFDDWWNFSQTACDQFADDIFVKSPGREDWFNQYHSSYQNEIIGLRKLAEKSRGYVGSSDWSKRLRPSHLSDEQRKSLNLGQLRPPER